MKYIDVVWIHESEPEPVRLVSELHADRFETRKIEFFRNGQVGYASANGSTLGTDLGSIAVPPLEEINLESQFHGIEISSNEFELLWGAHVIKI